MIEKIGQHKDFELISVVVPAYKQETTIVRDIKSIQEVLEKIRFEYEMIIVVDGSPDETYKEAKKVESKKVKVVTYDRNQGKGYAVRYGLSLAKGDPVAFIDAGMDLDPNALGMLLEHMLWYRADIIVGSKRHPASRVHYPFFRRIQSAAYQTLVYLLFGLKIRDTQVGLKFYRRRVLEKILNKLVVNRFAFDIELLAVANAYGFSRIYEAPIEVDYNFASTIRPKNVLEVLQDTFQIYFDLLRGFYKKNHNSLLK